MFLINYPARLTLLQYDTYVPNFTASSEYRVFSNGFVLNQLGPHAWGFEPTSKLLWHDRYFHSPEDMPGINEKNEVNETSSQSCSSSKHLQGISLAFVVVANRIVL